jgi:hypothetical protein
MVSMSRQTASRVYETATAAFSMNKPTILCLSCYGLDSIYFITTKPHVMVPLRFIQ